MSEQSGRAPRNLFPDGELRHADFKIEVRRAEPVAGRGTSDDERTFEIAISSEAEIERWFGLEILDHSRAAVDLTRLRTGAAVLVDHRGDQVGVVEPSSARVDGDRVLRARIRFSRSARGREIEQDVVDGIRRNISVGYFVKEAKLIEERRVDGVVVDVWRATRWTPAEVSLVAVPADVSVGVGRSAERVTRGKSPGGFMDEREKQTTTVDARAEAAEIAELCDAHGVGHRAAGWIGEGLTADQVSARILESKRTKPFGQPSAEQLDGLSARDRNRYSFARALLLAAGEVRGGVEAEYSAELERRLPADCKRHGGIFIPLDRRTEEDRWRDEEHRHMERRTLDSKVSGKGGETIFEQAGELIELLRARAAVVTLGARTLTGLSSPVGFPKQTGPMTAYWVGENPGADVTSSDISLGVSNLVPKTLQGNTAFSRQLMVQSSLDVEAMVRGELAAIHALAIDRAAIHGEGAAGEPTGIYKAPDVNVRAVGGAPDLADIADFPTLVAADNALAGTLGWVMTTGLASKLRQTLEFSAAGARTIWTGPLTEGDVFGYRAIASNQVSSTMTGSEDTGGSEHGIIFGNWADLLIGLFGALEVIVDPFMLKKRGLVEVTSFQMADILLRHPESFAKGTGATA